MSALATLDDGLTNRHEQTGAFEALTIQGGFLPRVGLYSGKSKQVERGLFPANHYGVTTGKDKLTDIGETFITVPLSYRPMALDLRGTAGKKAIAYYDFNLPQFKEVTEVSTGKDSKCMSGIQFLLTIQGFGLATYFCASKSSKMIAPAIRKLVNKYVKFYSDTVEAGPYVWRAPFVVESTVEFDLGDTDVLKKARADFIAVGPIQEGDGLADGDEAGSKAATPDATNSGRPR